MPPSATIYIENQFLTSPLIADRLADRLHARPELEVVIVAPRSHDSWVEAHTMRNGRIRFWRRIARRQAAIACGCSIPQSSRAAKRPTP